MAIYRVVGNVAVAYRQIYVVHAAASGKRNRTNDYGKNYGDYRNNFFPYALLLVFFSLLYHYIFLCQRYCTVVLLVIYRNEKERIGRSFRCFWDIFFTRR